MVVNIVPELISFGFSEYEARAYAGLLGFSMPMTAYEMAKEAGIPTSKIYEVIGKLLEKEVIVPLEESGKKKYLALDPDEFLRKYQSRFESSLGRVKKEFSRIKEKSHAAMIWNFREYDLLISRTSRIIDDAEKTLLLSLWNNELKALEVQLRKAEKRGVRISIIHFGNPQIKVGQVFQHPIEDTLYSEKGGRGFTIVMDGKEALTATIYSNGDVEGAWSENRGFTTLAEDYIKHDVYIMKVVERFNHVLIERFGDNYKLMRDVFHNEEIIQN